MANNLIVELNKSIGMSVEQIHQGLCQRTNNAAPSVADIQQWLVNSATIPEWVNKTAALWIIELWMGDRDACQAGSLLTVDKKYSRILRGFSMAEIISMRQQLAS